MFHNLQNYDSHLIFQELWKYNFKKKCYTRTIEKDKSFISEQSKRNIINPRLPIVFIESVHFLNNS